MRMRARLIRFAAAAALLSAVPARAITFFIVFFDSGSAALTAPMQAVLDNVAAALAQSGYSVTLLGNADRAGDPAYNLGLACRRAQAVRAYLVSHGIPANRIAVQSAGEERPLVDTPDGILEPQNRSVTFTMSEHRPAAADGAGIAGCAHP